MQSINILYVLTLNANSQNIMERIFAPKLSGSYKANNRFHKMSQKVLMLPTFALKNVIFHNRR